METIYDAAQALESRFILQTDAYVEQWVGTDKSGYRKIVDANGKDVAVTTADVVSHIRGKKTIGIYQLKDNHVKTICLDVDSKDQEAAQKQTLLIAHLLVKQFGRQWFLVEDSGSKGYHVWMFFYKPVAASYAYRLGHWIRTHVEPVEGVNIEVFPKQESTTAYGNLIKLPWGINKKSGRRCLFVNAKFEPLENQLDALSDVFTLDNYFYDIGEYLEKIGAPLIERYEYKGGDRYKCMNNLMTNGAVDGSRDIGFFKLACFLRGQGFPQHIAEMVLEETNNRSHPPAPERDVQDKVDSAYKNGYNVNACREPGLDVYCSASCAFFERKAEQRGMSVEQLRRYVGND